MNIGAIGASYRDDLEPTLPLYAHNHPFHLSDVRHQMMDLDTWLFDDITLLPLLLRDIIS